MWCVYIIQSKMSGRYYVGSTNDLERSLHEHNIGHTPSTRNKGPWTVVHTEAMENRESARFREKQIKAWKSRAMIEALVGRASE